MQSLYSAASGLSGQQKRLEILSANIANAGTIGYKSARVEFKDALYTTMDNPISQDSYQNNLLSGSGVLLNATTLDLKQGVTIQTGFLLDFAIEGDGFFAVQNQEGETLYTRNGAFSAADIDGTAYLVTAQGHFVLDADGNRITLPNDGSALSVAENGELQTAEGATVTIGLFKFPNSEGLSPQGETLFGTTAASGQPELDADAKIVQGGLENSNVDLAQELTMLIRAQRAYSLASRALTTSDDMLGLANNMR